MPTDSSKVHMLLLMRGEGDPPRVMYVPGTYDVITKVGEILDKDNVKFPEFADAVLADTTVLAQGYMYEWAKQYRDVGVNELSDGDRRELLCRLLGSFSERPMELVGNMFASTVVACVEEALKDPEFDEHYEEWAQVFHDSE